MLQRQSVPRKRWMADVVPLEDQAKLLWRAPSSNRKKTRRNFIDVAELVRLQRGMSFEHGAWSIDQ